MLSVTNLNQFHLYLTGVVNRAGHHANNVVDCIFPLTGAIMLYGKDIDLYGSGQNNALWFKSRRTNMKYAMSYDHRTQQIVMKQGSFQGPVVHRFDRSNVGYQAIMQIFPTL